jgi:hypothetical protein
VVHGSVVDVAGRAVANAVVQLTLPAALRSRVGVVLDAAEDRSWQARSGPGGSCTIEAAPDLDGLTATCGAIGHAAWHGDVSRPLDVVLTPFADGVAHTIRGRVEAADGSPVAGARVSLAGRDTASGNDGSFELPFLAPLPHGARLVAMADGHGPAIVDDPRQWSSFVVLRLPEVTVYSGIVREAAGQAIAGATVQLLPALSELTDARVERVTSAPHERLRVGPALQLVSVTTDEHGAFLIEAPAFASVCVIAVDMHTLRARTVDAGARRRDIEIVFDDDPLRRIAGTVVDQWQRPMRRRAAAWVHCSSSPAAMPATTTAAAACRPRKLASFQVPS